MKRILGCLLALCILYCGCADKIAEPAPGGQAGTETEIISTEPAQTPNAALEIREDTILQGGEYASGTPGQHVILVSGARLSGVGLTLDKSGDGSAAGEDGVLTGTENAALLAENGAYAEVSGSAISSGAAGGHAVAVTDGSALLADTMIVTTGSGAAALYVSGGSAELRRSELVSGSGSASALYVTASGSVTTSRSAISPATGTDQVRPREAKPFQGVIYSWTTKDGRRAYSNTGFPKEGEYFDAELEGLMVLDDETGEELGKLTRVLNYPAHKVYEVRGKREYLIPAVREVFIRGVDMETGTMRVRNMKGLATDED